MDCYVADAQNALWGYWERILSISRIWADFVKLLRVEIQSCTTSNAVEISQEVLAVFVIQP